MDKIRFGKVDSLKGASGVVRGQACSEHLVGIAPSGWVSLIDHCNEFASPGI